jgi:hypothetical protein
MGFVVGQVEGEVVKFPHEAPDSSRQATFPLLQAGIVTATDLPGLT